MDFYSSKTPDSFKLIRALFYILMVVITGIVSLLFILSLHESVHSDTGEIISKNTPIDYLAPFEAEIKEVRVQGGMEVKKGDTLVILYNDDIQVEYEKDKKNLQLALDEIDLLNQQIENRRRRIDVQQKEVGSIKTDLKFSEKGKSQELIALEQQVKTLNDKLQISKSTLLKDKGLLRKGAISQMDYDEKFKAYLEEANRLGEIKSRLAQKELTFQNFGNDSESRLGRQQLTILNGEAELLSLQKNLQQEEGHRIQLEQQIAAKEKELAKRYLIADMDGYVSQLYNHKKEVSFIRKGTSVVLLRPKEEESFFAKLPISEEAVKDIQSGLETRIQLKAYSHYQYGIIKGEVMHLDKDEKNAFYVLASIPAEYKGKFDLKSGYKIKGEIIIEKLKLYQYIFKKMFKKMEG